MASLKNEKVSRRRSVVVAVSGLVLGAFLLSSLGSAGAARPRSKRSKVVGIDPEGDWGVGATGPLGKAQGADLVKASIGMADGTTLRFVFEVAELSNRPVGSLPVGYAWDFEIEGKNKALRNDVFEIESCEPDFQECFDQYQRGLEGDEFSFYLLSFPKGGSSGGFRSLGLLKAKLDPSKRTISVDVPISTLRASSDGSLPSLGSRIVASEEFGPSARTFSGVPANGPSDSPLHAIPNDDLEITRRFAIPTRGHAEH